MARSASIALAAALMWLLSAVPAAPQTIPPSTVGGVPLQGLFTYEDGATLPPAGVPCGPTSWVFEGGSSAALAVNTVVTGHLGPVRVIGSGGSACANALQGAGTASFTVTGEGPTGSDINCSGTLDGGYVRVVSFMRVDVAGECMINNFVTRVHVTCEGAFVPSDAYGRPAAGPGVSEDVKYATYDALCVVTPA